jgi:hypothetical protein
MNARQAREEADLDTARALFREYVDWNSTKVS